MKNTGGPAFPELIALKSNSHDYRAESAGGMTLLDCFAAKAMVGMFADSDFATHDAGIVTLAKAAYKMADAMIAERNKPENNNV